MIFIRTFTFLTFLAHVEVEANKSIKNTKLLTLLITKLRRAATKVKDARVRGSSVYI